jgi:hypothetical protein
VLLAFGLAGANGGDVGTVIGVLDTAEADGEEAGGDAVTREPDDR